MKGQRSAPPLISPELERQSRPGQRRFGCQGERQLSDESERDRPGRTFHPRLCATPLSARRHPSLPPSNHGLLSLRRAAQTKRCHPPTPLSFHSPTFFQSPPNQAAPQSFTQRAGLTGAALCRTGRLQSNIMSSHMLQHTHTDTYGTHHGGWGRLLARSGCCQSCRNFWGILSWEGFFTLLFPGCCRHTSVTSLKTNCFLKTFSN